MLSKAKTIGIGDKIDVIINGEVKELEIVDLPQGDARRGKISWLSPLAQALLGKKRPSRVVVQLPNGKTVECRLLVPLV
ncbi:MAG: GreA/GreB family elongation factor [Patescibacteria group bacterium]|jgi:transcription elongation GreA/GreB family factor